MLSAAAWRCPALPGAPPSTHRRRCRRSPACLPASPVVPGKDSADQAELALQPYQIKPVCREHMPGMAWAHPHQ